MTCVAVDTEGYVYVLDPQPATAQECALVIHQGDAAAYSPFALSPEQGTEIGISIVLVWAVATVARLCIRALSVDTTQE